MTFNYTDLGNAERFVAQHGNDVRFVPDWGKWLVWDNKRWQVDEEGAVPRKAFETAHGILNEAHDLGNRDRADLVKHWMRSESEPRIRAMQSLASNFEKVVVRAASLDSHPNLIGLPNGVLDLETGELHSARREDRITKLASCEYDPEARAPRWDIYLDRVLGGNAELKNYMQRAVGYSLTGHTVEQCLFFLHGLGRNGKSIFLSVVRELLGEYAMPADFNTFLERRNDGPRSDLARLQGARFVPAIETSEGRRLNEGVVKQLTGEDSIVARFLYGSEFEFRPQFKLWFAANHKPIIRGTDPAIWRRIHLVPFTVTIPPEEVDPTLRDVLKKELSGILNWAVEGCQLWMEYGLKPPDAVRAATEEYRQESDTIGAFLAERCEFHPDASTPAAALYNAFKDWCEKTGEYRLSQTAFGRRLSERGIEPGQSGSGYKKVKVRVGVRLIPTELENDEPWTGPRAVSSRMAGPEPVTSPQLEEELF